MEDAVLPECPIDRLPKTIGSVLENSGLVVTALVCQMCDYFVALSEVLDLVSDSRNYSGAIGARYEVWMAEFEVEPALLDLESLRVLDFMWSSTYFGDHELAIVERSTVEFDEYFIVFQGWDLQVFQLQAVGSILAV